MEPSLTQADLEELEQRPLEERIEVLDELERALHDVLEQHDALEERDVTAAATVGEADQQPAMGTADHDPEA